MTICKISYILLFMCLLSVGLLAGLFCKKDNKYKKLKTDCVTLRQENIYLKKIRQEFLKEQQYFQSICHDIKNDYILEMGYLEKQHYQPLKEHYLKKLGHLKKRDNLIYTGIIGMDAILNHKKESARMERIRINIHPHVSTQVKIDNHDLNLILGNLLDNAIEAVRWLKLEEREIALKIYTNATSLILEINNKYLGKLQKDKEGNYMTQKTDKDLHGLGLLKIRYIAHKYGGKVVIKDENNYFRVRVLLYMPE